MRSAAEAIEEDRMPMDHRFERADNCALSADHAEYLALRRFAGQVAQTDRERLTSVGTKVGEARPHCSALGYPVQTEQPTRTKRLGIDGSPVDEWPLSDHPRVREAYATLESTVRECVIGFKSGDLAHVQSLFADNARLITPFEGSVDAQDALARLIRRPDGARLTLHGVRLLASGCAQAMGYFLYDGWRRLAATAENDRLCVFNYVLNIEPSHGRIVSMVVM